MAEISEMKAEARAFIFSPGTNGRWPGKWFVSRNPGDGSGGINPEDSRGRVRVFGSELAAGKAAVEANKRLPRHEETRDMVIIRLAYTLTVAKLRAYAGIAADNAANKNHPANRRTPNYWANLSGDYESAATYRENLERQARG